jgi:endonuclease/exonuclease/phosphatase (EEP) superfamily protein YafD
VHTDGERPPTTTAARVVGRVLLAPTWLLVIGLLAVATMRLVAFDRRQLFLLLNSFTLWLYLPAYAVMVAAICFRHRVLAVAAGVLVVVHVTLVLPGLFRTVSVPEAARRAPRLRVVSANLRYNNAQSNRLSLLAELRSFHADVLALEEVTPEWWQTIEASGLLDDFRGHVERSRSDAGGLALLSRVPMRDIVVHDIAGWPMITASVAVGSRTVHVAAVHVAAPIGTSELGRRQQQAATAVERALARPRVVAGDFNASPYNRWFAQQRDLGLREAHEAVGRPFATTWPNGLHHVPPLRLDHVFADPSIVPLDASEGRGQGSDHRPIVVDLAVM